MEIVGSSLGTGVVVSAGGVVPVSGVVVLAVPPVALVAFFLVVEEVPPDVVPPLEVPPEVLPPLVVVVPQLPSWYVWLPYVPQPYGLAKAWTLLKIAIRLAARKILNKRFIYNYFTILTLMLPYECKVSKKIEGKQWLVNLKS
jgi:hypothetical protein